MAARIKPGVFESEIANLAQFKARVDVAVDVVLLLGDLYVLLRRDVHLLAKIRVGVQSIGVDVSEWM